MIEMEDSPREKMRLKDEFKEYIQTKRPVLEDVDTSEDEANEPAVKDNKKKEATVAADDDSLALDTSTFSSIQQVDEGWFSDHVTTASDGDDISEVDDESREDPSFQSNRSRNANEVYDSDSVYDDDQDEAENVSLQGFAEEAASKTSTSVIPKKSLKTVFSNPRQFTSVSNVLSKPMKHVVPNSMPVVPSLKIPPNMPKDTQVISLRKRKKMQYLASLAGSPTRSALTEQSVNQEEPRQTRSSATKAKNDTEHDLLEGEISPFSVPRVAVAKILRQKRVATDIEDSEDDGQNLYDITKTKKRSSKKSKQ
jgi:hypothetical protein